MKCNVAIIGGGPAGSTVGTFLRKHRPDLEVCIFEGDLFPRDHVGESQLPAVPVILNELGVWDKVEAADFPIKLGARYRWGPEGDDDLWESLFIRDGEFQDQPRPGKYEGQRAQTAFQVDRAIFDEILLDHSAEMGCQVFEETRVVNVLRNGDAVDHLVVKDKTGEEETVFADWFVDASGASATIRKAFDIPVDSPTALKNIAIWDYWQNADWAELVGVGGTLVQVMSLSYGWLWFIPLGPTRTSIGLVTSADYYKNCGLSTDALYRESIAKEPRITKLVENASREDRLQATKDWSFIAGRMAGENWFLVGDASGFADPILAAGMTLAMTGAKRVAFSILEIMRGEVDEDWLKGEYERIQSKHVGNHIRFANYWYSLNGKFTDLRAYCSDIARNAGLELEPDDAFQWLGTGGFTDEFSGIPFAGTFDVSAIKALAKKYSGQPISWTFQKNNVFELRLEGARKDVVGVYEDGRVHQVECYFRDGKTLPMYLLFGFVFRALQKEREILFIWERTGFEAKRAGFTRTRELARVWFEVLEVLVIEGWVEASFDPAVQMMSQAPIMRK